MNDKLDGLLFGSFIGDSLALAAHWDYNSARIASSFGRITDYLAPAPDHYHAKRDAGEFTHYGDQAVIVLESITRESGFDLADFATRWQAIWPSYDGYIDGATKDTLKNFAVGKSPSEAGSTSTDLSAAGRIAPLLYHYAEKSESELLAAVEVQTAMTHNDHQVVEAAVFFTWVTRSVLEGLTVEDAIKNAALQNYAHLPVQSWIERAVSHLDMDPATAAQKLGLSCAVVDAFPTVIYFLLKYPDDFESALIENVMAGGDSAARGLIIGMVLGARAGLEGIPKRWVSGLKAADQIRHLAGKSIAPVRPRG